VPALLHKDEQEKAACCVADCQACQHAFTYQDIEQQRKLRTKVTRGRPAMFDFLLRGLAFCGVCHTALIQSTQRYVYHRLRDGTYRKYPLKNPISLLRCQSQQITNTTGRRCREPGYLRSDRVISYVKHAILTALLDPKPLIGEPINDHTRTDSMPDARTNEARLRWLAATLEEKRQNLVALWRDKQAAILDEDVFHILNTTLREEKSAIEAELDSVFQATHRRNQERQRIRTAVDTLQRLRSHPEELERADDATWREVVMALLTRVEVMADGSVRCIWQRLPESSIADAI
jgi:hypothetical protein